MLRIPSSFLLYGHLFLLTTQVSGRYMRWGDALKLKDIFLTVIIIILGWQVLRLNEELFSLGEITLMTMSGVFSLILIFIKDIIIKNLIICRN